VSAGLNVILELEERSEVMNTKAMLKAAMPVLFAALAVAVAAIPLVADDFVWDGSAANNNWTTETNWDRNNGYPDGLNDRATIDDPTYHNGDVRADTGFDVGVLFLGDGHKLELTANSSVGADENYYDGRLEFDGIVKLKGIDGSRSLEAGYITINTDQTTKVVFVDNSYAGFLLTVL